MILDTLITNGIVITMEGNGVGIIDDGAVGFKDNIIKTVGPTSEVLKEYSAHRYINAENKAVMPGLIDAHIHTGIGLMRGVAQDINNWMQQGMWPFENQIRQDTDAVMKGSLMNILESLKAGTTTFCDFDYPMCEIVRNHDRIGTRACVTELINEFSNDLSSVKVGDLYPLDPSIGDQKLQNNLKLIEAWHGKDNGRITCMLGPQGPDMVRTELLLEIAELSKKLGLSIHMHVSQSEREINQMVKRYGKRSIQYLDELGYLNPSLLAVHLTTATPEETHAVAKSGAGMVLCSGSIGITNGIVPPAYEFLEVSNRLALGSDQAPGNNCNNMFNEMKMTALLNKCKRNDPVIFPAWKVLRMATIESARAIGKGDEIGSLRAGKKADIIIIDMMQPAVAPIIKYPVRNIVPNLVYSAKGSEVETVIIDGESIIEDFKVLSVNERTVVSEAMAAAKRVCDKAAKDFFAQKTPLFEMMENDCL
jgi:5-methylthioadenosine/S-adenosylhomocysteine deaminase